jgi:hypothetical protein
LIYSTYLGGINFDQGAGIAVDSANCAYVTGFTASTNFPTTNFIHQVIGLNLYYGGWLNGFANNINNNGYFANDAFVTKFSPSGTNLVYSTFLGGANNDVANSIAVDAAGNAYVTGWTVSTNYPNIAVFPSLPNGLTNNFVYGYNATTNAFLTKIMWNGTNASIGYSSVFGGTNYGVIDAGQSVAVDASGDAFVAGTTSSTNFPTFLASNAGFLRATNSGGNDVFVTAFNTNGTALLYSVYLGGANNDFGNGLALDPAGNAYVVGQTLSANFPTNNARQATLNGPSDAFLAKILSNLSSVPDLSAMSAGTNVLVSWPAMLPFAPELPEFIKLESNTNLLSTNSWVLVPQPPVLTGTNYTYMFNPTNPVLFFRLQEF